MGKYIEFGDRKDLFLILSAILLVSIVSYFDFKITYYLRPQFIEFYICKILLLAIAGLFATAMVTYSYI